MDLHFLFLIGENIPIVNWTEWGGENDADRLEKFKFIYLFSNFKNSLKWKHARCCQLIYIEQGDHLEPADSITCSGMCLCSCAWQDKHTEIKFSIYTNQAVCLAFATESLQARPGEHAQTAQVINTCANEKCWILSGRAFR